MSRFPRIGVLLVIVIVIVLSLIAYSTAIDGDTDENDNNTTTSDTDPLSKTDFSNATHTKLHLIGWRIDQLRNYLALTLFVIVVILFKLVYYHSPVLTSYIPESCILITLGCLFGLILRFGYGHHHYVERTWKLSPDLFFLVLLPPIILEASYNLFNRKFAENIVTILLFATLGTLLNFLIIGVGLWAFNLAGAMGFPHIRFTLLHSLLFSSLIVAVDPVAVLAIFQEIGVDENLYYLVFGESLFNDAVTVVLYDMIKNFLDIPEVTLSQISLGILSFFTVSLGGLAVGLLIGILCCLLTRVTYVSRVLEPLIIFTCGYFSYILGNLFEWSGIISMIGCGIMQAAYAFHNISGKSLVSVHRFVGMVASISEAIIFLFLGVELVTGDHEWHTGFSLWSLVFCLMTRAVVIIFLAAVANKGHVAIHSISWTEKFIVAYGGLRGAVAFSLATLIKDSFGDGDLTRSMIITTTLFIVLFTVFVLGLTLKPIVRLLKIDLAHDDKLSLMEETNACVYDHLMAGVEAVIGQRGKNSYTKHFDRLDDRYIRKLLQRDPETHDERILKVFEKISLEIHFATILPRGASEKHLERLPQLIRQKLIRDRIQQANSPSGFPGIPITPEVSANLLTAGTPSHRLMLASKRPSKSLTIEGNEVETMRKLFRSRKTSFAQLDKTRQTDSDFLTTVNTVFRAKKSFLRHRHHHLQQEELSSLSQYGESTAPTSEQFNESPFTRRELNLTPLPCERRSQESGSEFYSPLASQSPYTYGGSHGDEEIGEGAVCFTLFHKDEESSF